MTLRYEGKQPVGLDWSVCHDGTNDSRVWKTANLPANEPKVRSELKRAAGGGNKQRLAIEIENQIIVLYRDEKKSAKEIAEIVGIRPNTVFKVLRRNEVPSRSKSEGMRVSKKHAERIANAERTPTGKFA